MSYIWQDWGITSVFISHKSDEVHRRYDAFSIGMQWVHVFILCNDGFRPHAGKPLGSILIFVNYEYNGINYVAIGKSVRKLHCFVHSHACVLWVKGGI